MQFIDAEGASGIPGTLLIRADSGPTVGGGHVMRCLALAEAWSEAGGCVHFVAATGAPATDARIKEIGTISTPPAEGLDADAAFTAGEAARLRADWVVLDGYAFGEAFERTVGLGGRRILTIDDLGARSRFCCDVLLNHNAYADEAMYAGSQGAKRFLLGSRYALLRREFRDRNDIPRQRTDVPRRLLVSLGGGDSGGVGSLILEAVRSLGLSGLETVVLVGPNDPCRDRIMKEVEDAGAAFRVEAGTQRMAEWMAWADVSIQGGGVTVWECCRMGLPSMLICMAENQRRIVESVVAAGAAESLGWRGALSVESLAVKIGAFLGDATRRKAVAAVAGRLIDGLGAVRVRKELQNPD